MNSALDTVENSGVVLSVIIVNYNGKRFFDDCLKSIDENVPFGHEVIVVDNASVDGSSRYLLDSYPDVILIESEKNLGFAGGNNIGVRHARGKYILLLNNDTILLDELGPAINLMEKDPSIGVAGIRMLGKNKEYRYSAGYYPEPPRLLKFSSLYKKNEGFNTGNFESNRGLYDVDWVEGSFLLTRSKLWRDLGGLDEAYFMYVEDIDYAKKAKESGMRVVYLPNLSYVHFGGYGEGRIGMLIHGFRRYHKTHSSYGKRLLANAVLDFGLLARAFMCLLGAVRDKESGQRAVWCLKALRRSK